MAKKEPETDAGADKRANYDVTLKLHLRALISLFSFRLGEIESVEAEDFQSFVEQNVEFNEFIQRRVDGLFKLTRKDGRVFYLHIEVQAFPYKKMRWRMLFYCSMIGLAYDRRPTQLILYIGEPDPRWKHTIPFRKGLYDYEVVTFYETPSEVFLKAPEPELWAYAILGAQADTKALVRDIFLRLHAAPEVDETRCGEIIQIMEELARLRRKLNVKKIIKELYIEMEIKVNIRNTFLFEEGKAEGIEEEKARAAKQYETELQAEKARAAKQYEAELAKLKEQNAILRTFTQTLLADGLSIEQIAEKTGRTVKEVTLILNDNSELK